MYTLAVVIKKFNESDMYDGLNINLFKGKVVLFVYKVEPCFSNYA